MKSLQAFMKFDWDNFSADKEFTVKSVSDWTDYHTKEKLGIKVEVVISKDDTVYPSKSGTEVSNIYETLFFKVKKDIDVPLKKKVIPVNANVTAYGLDRNGKFSSYLNCLSITCDDISFV